MPSPVLQLNRIVQTLRPLIAPCIVMFGLAALLAVGGNMLRPEEKRIPWAQDWSTYIEAKAFKAGIPVIFLLGVQEAIDEAGTYILDARNAEAYEEGHLPSALSLPIEDADIKIGDYVQLLTFTTPLVVYCDGADCTDSLELAIKLRGYGFEDIHLYPGGYAEWVEYGQPLHTGDAP